MLSGRGVCIAKGSPAIHLFHFLPRQIVGLRGALGVLTAHHGGESHQYGVNGGGRKKSPSRTSLFHFWVSLTCLVLIPIR